MTQNSPYHAQCLSLLEKSANTGYWSVDLVSDQLYWSDEIYRIHGVSKDQYTPTVETAVEFYHPQDRERVIDSLQNAIEHGQNFSFELRLIRADESIRYVKAKAECAFDSQHKVVGVCGIFQDITEWVESTSQYEQIQEIHQRYIESSNDGYWDWYIQDDYQYMSPRFWEIFGYTPDEKPHKPSAWQDMIFEEDLAIALDNFDKHVKTKGKHPYEQEVRYRHKDGSTVTVLCRGQMVGWRGDEPLRMVGAHTDITHLKLVEGALRDNKGALEQALDFQRLLMNVNTDLVFVKDDQFRLVEANQAFINLYPKNMHDKIIGYTTLEEYPPDQVEKLLQQDKLAFAEGVSETEEQITFPDGSERMLLTKKIRFEDNTQKPLILCIARDITDLKQAQNELLNANEELEEFAYRTSHDLRSPLISSINLLDLVDSAIEQGNNAQAFKYNAVIKTSLVKLEELVTDILTLTKVNHEAPLIEPVNIESQVKGVMQEISHMQNIENITFDFSYEFAQDIHLQKLHLHLIIVNLLSNAVKYQDAKKDKSFVNVSTRRENDKVVMEITDNGLGIPERSQQQLFSMFKRFHPRTSYGSGLGLYMVKKSIDKMGGEITYHNTGSGSCFTIKLPIVNNENT